MAHRLDSSAATAVQGGPGRRISANSFKLLTAKLKKVPVPELAPLLAPVIAPEPVAMEPAAAEPIVEAAPAPSPEIVEIAVEPVAIHAVELPEFQPIDFYVPRQDTAEEQSPAISSEAAPLESEPETVELEAIESEAGSFEISAEPQFALLPEFSFEPVIVEPIAEEPAAEDVLIEQAFVQEAVTDEAQREEPVFDEGAEEEPGIEAAHVAEPSINVPHAEVEALEAFAADFEPDSAIDSEEHSAAAEPAAQDELPPEEEPSSAVMMEQAEPVAPEIEEPATIVEAMNLKVLAAEQRQKVEEPKAPASHMAERVVDAMLKTISTAVYAKPTASERAAFLREMAVLMDQEAAENGEAAPIVAEASIGAVHMPPAVQAAEDASIAEALASRIGPAAALLKPKAESEDPFAQNIKLSRLVDPKPAETVDADEESGELAITLLDMMSGGSGTALPHERTLAADTLLRILPRIPVKQLLAVVERVAIMETPPALLVAKLIRDPRHEVVGPLLERCSHISDQDLMNAAPDGDAPKLRMIARRRILSTVLSDYLISIGEPGVLLTLIRNPGAAIAHDAFFRLAEHATHHHGLLAPLATRADLPPPVAFELFWHVPQELRRFIFSRFLTDSETLNKILRITLSTHADASNEVVGEGKFPSREAIESAVSLAANFKLDEAARQFADIGSISKDTALRILSDREGEPITVLFKALGYPRSKFEEALARLRHADSGVLRPDRNPEEMQAIFDSLSFNKARILLTYWDWFVRKAGPYSPHN